MVRKSRAQASLSNTAGSQRQAGGYSFPQRSSAVLLKPPPSGRVPVAPCRLPAPQGSTEPRARPQSCLSSLAAELRRPFRHLLVARPGPWPRGLPSRLPCRPPHARPWEAAGSPGAPQAWGARAAGGSQPLGGRPRAKAGETQGAERKANGCNRPRSPSSVTHPFCLSVGFAFCGGKAWVTFSAGSIAVREKRRGLEEQHRWAQGGQGGRGQWQQSEGGTKQKKGQRRRWKSKKALMSLLHSKIIDEKSRFFASWVLTDKHQIMRVFLRLIHLVKKLEGSKETWNSYLHTADIFPC